MLIIVILNISCERVNGIVPQIANSWGQHGAHLGPVGPDWTHVGLMNLAIRDANRDNSNPGHGLMSKATKQRLVQNLRRHMPLQDL